MEWHGYIADGHNRYSICRKHNIEPMIGTLAYETKEEVMEWMPDIQLGRRNLPPIQRTAVAEKYRPIYEKQAKERQSEYHSNEYDKKSGLTEKLPQVQNNKERNPTTDKKLSDIAGVSEKTYRMGKKILNSDNEGLKQAFLYGILGLYLGLYRAFRLEVGSCWGYGIWWAYGQMWAAFCRCLLSGRIGEEAKY